MIKNATKRFPVFVSNRLSQIEAASEPSQWHFVEGVQNPTDDASRGLNSVGRLKDLWLHGPQFLLELESEWPKPPCLLPDLPDEFKILKRSTVGVTNAAFIHTGLITRYRKESF